MKILITGGAGFIGTNAALYFGKDRTNAITVVDNLSRVGTAHNVQTLTKTLGKRLTFIKSDIAKTASYLSALKRADVIIHLAGQTAVTTSIADPFADFTTNIGGGVTILESVRKYNPQAVVLYSSTNKVYGNLAHHTMKLDRKKERYDNVTCPKGVNEQEQLNFISPYGCSKGTIDQYMLDYARTYGLKTVVFRQSCIYGPHQLGVEDQGWVAHFSKQFIFKKPIVIFGDGYQVRDLLYVEDLVRLYDAAINRIAKTQGHVFNAGGGVQNSFSLREVLRILEKKVGYSPSISFSNERLGDQKYFVSDNTKAYSVLKWKPQTLFTKGVDALISWQQNHLL
jgi:CDP-paratose 2-epimerase